MNPFVTAKQIHEIPQELPRENRSAATSAERWFVWSQLETRDAPCSVCGHLLWWLEQRSSEHLPVLTPETPLDELISESLEVVELVMELEDQLGVSVSDVDYAQLRMVWDVRRLFPDQL